MELEINKIYQEDCVLTMARMPDNFIDLTVTSPPYDKLRDYKGYSFDFEKIAQELLRVTQEGGVVVWVVNDATINGSETGTSFKQALYFKEIGFNLHDTMIYHKQNSVPFTSNRYVPSFEYMFVFSKGIPKTFNPIRVPCKYAGHSDWSKPSNYTADGVLNKAKKEVVINDTKIKNNIFSYLIGSITSTCKINHPAMFPEQLASDHIITWSNEGELVYDPFGGSGTTAKMAKMNERKWIISEISEEYCKIIEERLNFRFIKQETFDFGEGF